MSEHPSIAQSVVHFSAQEVAQLAQEDQAAGRLVGQLLGGFFVILVAMMVGCAWWTAWHLPPSSDPQSGFREVVMPAAGN
ncbi:hypothetical protein Spb1_30350 [Planctopirus ephydatiae]|jgi:hypothetical protein|uniref:Uncharacterized protein n=1 Tax=Planctopirus ephydatiae TaxID=2528019 RepID=A0A518GR75_9PLAN|nr:hypothetical protein [Planctopirus ephydatiae]QDV31097.1 hypothetical protein Spb1_30350 [Planctopirus ephydatiae]